MADNVEISIIRADFEERVAMSVSLIDLRRSLSFQSFARCRFEASDILSLAGFGTRGK